MKMIFLILKEYFDKEEVSQSFLMDILSTSKGLPKNDLKTMLGLTSKLLGI